MESGYWCWWCFTQCADGSQSSRPLTATGGLAISDQRLLFAVGDPDIFDLHGVPEEPASLCLCGIEPIDKAAFIREDLFQISRGKRFCRGGANGVSERP